MLVVGLSAEFGDVVHDRIREGAGSGCFGLVGCAGTDRDGFAIADANGLERPGYALAGLLDRIGADQADRDDGCRGLDREQSGTPVSTVQLAVTGTSALRIRADGAVMRQYVGCSDKGASGAGWTPSPYRDLAGSGEQPAGEPVVEVLGLGQEGNWSWTAECEEDRVHERPVVGCQNDRSLVGKVFDAFDLDPVKQSDQATQCRSGEPVGQRSAGGAGTIGPLVGDTAERFMTKCLPALLSPVLVGVATDRYAAGSLSPATPHNNRVKGPRRVLEVSRQPQSEAHRRRHSRTGDASWAEPGAVAASALTV